MPRKEWKPKNRYCKKSRLDEEAFTTLFQCFLIQMSSSATAKYLTEKRGVKISRQTVNKYFLNFGYHLFIHFYYSDISLFLLKDKLIEAGISENLFDIESDVLFLYRHRYSFSNARSFWIDEVCNHDEAEIREHDKKVFRNSNAYREFLQTGHSDQEVLEIHPNGYMFNPIKDNSLIISYLRVANRINYGFENQYYESFLGKAYFCCLCAIRPNMSNKQIIQNWLSKPWEIGEVYILINLVFGSNPMILQPPENYIEFMKQNMGFEPISNQ